MDVAREGFWDPMISQSEDKNTRKHENTPRNTKIVLLHDVVLSLC